MPGCLVLLPSSVFMTSTKLNNRPCSHPQLLDGRSTCLTHAFLTSKIAPHALHSVSCTAREPCDSKDTMLWVPACPFRCGSCSIDCPYFLQLVRPRLHAWSSNRTMVEIPCQLVHAHDYGIIAVRRVCCRCGRSLGVLIVDLQYLKEKLLLLSQMTDFEVGLHFIVQYALLVSPCSGRGRSGFCSVVFIFSSSTSCDSSRC